MKKKNLLQRSIIIGIVTLAGLYIVIGPHGRRPHLKDFTYSGIKATLADNIHLGLDLKGGSHLVMRVKVEDYLKHLTEDNATAAELAAKQQNLEVKEAHAETAVGNYRVVVQAADPSKVQTIRDAVEKDAVAKKAEFGESKGWSFSASGPTMTWTLTSAAERTLSESATDQAFKIIDSRINTLGVAEPTLQRNGAQNSHEILLQMPGIQDPERVKALLGNPSRLELVHVVSPASPSSVQTYATEQEALASLNSGGNIPANRRVLPYNERADAATTPGQEAKPKPTKWVVVESPGIIDGAQLRTASAVPARAGGDEYEIAFSLKPTGATRFGEWTGANIDQYMGVDLNDEVRSIAFIKSQITDQGVIEGRFTKDSADTLVLTLRSGALPAGIQYQEERTVGPSLGADSIRSGVRASV